MGIGGLRLAAARVELFSITQLLLKAR